MSIKDKLWYPVAFMFVVTAFFTAILVILAGFTRERVQANQRLAFERAVLQTVPVGVPPKASGIQIDKLFQEHLKDTTIRVSNPDTSYTFYLYRERDSLIAYALPVAGAGFWDKIKGVVAVAADKRTVIGIAFYEQNETPGLGGEIVKPDFRNQFKGKKIADQGTPLELRPVGAALDSSSVQAVTGATQTSTRLMRFANEQLARWRDAMDTTSNGGGGGG